MQFTLQGFVHQDGFRVFSFIGLTADRTKIPFTVQIDLALARRYGVQPQDFPLICCDLLEKQDSLSTSRNLVFDEKLMIDQAGHTFSGKPRHLLRKTSRSARAGGTSESH